MSKPGRRDPEKENFWRAILKEYQVSNEGQSAFCSRKGINVNSLNGWARILRSRDQEAMAPRRTQSRQDDAYWWSVLDKWRESNLTLKQFAAERKLNYDTLLRWKQKLLPEVQKASSSVNASTIESPALIVPVHIVEEKKSEPAASAGGETSASVLEVLLKCGRLLRISANCDPDFLREMVAIMESC